MNLQQRNDFNNDLSLYLLGEKNYVPQFLHIITRVVCNVTHLFPKAKVTSNKMEPKKRHHVIPLQVVWFI